MYQLEANPEDLKAIEQRVTAMLERIDHFGKVEMGHVMSDWQTQDMHRQRPFTMRWRGRQKKVGTVIRPHSNWEMKRSMRAQRRAIRHHEQPRHWSTRPILRPELLTKLFTEMQEAFARAIRW